MSAYRFCLHDEHETLVGEESKSCANDVLALQYARVLLARAPIVLVWREDRFVDRVTRPRVRLQSYRVEFLTPAETVAHAYEVKAESAREALAMARIEFARIRTRYDAHDYRVFDPRALIYFAQK
ncbi:hypothetical protein [Terricaulis sp.]|uniref:hypothetical protein n=1 Tax=Terricaulis sp. TaxID=2768686 RepID=UPI002AC68E17|nr:hypothetical protein [Terricaulis sp.]MDZ4690746.1 hypothetical protein [Terricaulis sp.]